MSLPIHLHKLAAIVKVFELLTYTPNLPFEIPYPTLKRLPSHLFQRNAAKAAVQQAAPNSSRLNRISMNIIVDGRELRKLPYRGTA